MNLPTPTTQEIYATMIAQIELSTSQTIPILPKAFVRVFARVFAGVFITLWKYAGSIALQLFVRTAQFGETTINGVSVNPLVEWGRLIGVGDPAPATPAELTFAVTVTNQSGFIPSSTQIVHSPTGIVYLTTASVPLDAPTVQVGAVASSDPNGNAGAGVAGTLEIGTEAAFASPISGVQRTVVVAGIVTPGTDAEAPDAYRARVIRRFQRRPQGGAYADYRAWGEEPSDAINVYPYTGQPGEVDVYVEVDATEYNPDGIPTQPQIDAVRDAIELDAGGKATRRPVNAAVNVLPITRVKFDVAVNGLAGTNVPETEDAIRRAVDDYLRSREPFILGLSVFPRTDRVTLAAVSGIIDETASARGHTVASVSIALSSDPGNTLPIYQLQDGQKAGVDLVTFN